MFEHENVLGQKQQYFALSNNKSIPLGQGQNYMIGIKGNKKSLTWDIEVFFKTLDGAIVHATSSPGFRNPANNITQKLNHTWRP